MEPSTHSEKGHDRCQIWLAQAKFDLDAAQISADGYFFEWACYQAVQSVEKCLKGVLVQAGWRPPKTHKLGVLMSMCNHANNSFLDVKLNFRKIEAFTFISRYPFVYPDQKTTPHDLITKEDALTCITLAQDIYIEIKSFIETSRLITPNPIKMEDYYFSEVEINSRLDSIAQLLSTDKNLEVSKVILFGSFARESTMPRTSTMDLIIIAETKMSFIERIEYVRELTRGGQPIIEPLIYTEYEFNLMLNEQGEGFIEAAIDEGRVVYESKAS
jgi:HEPN domain-containing protein/predicted nucleotidyltransferase